MRKATAVSLVLIISALLAVAPASALPAIVFSDDFSGDLSQWTAVSGTWAIESGELSQNETLTYPNIVAGSNWTDYTAKIEIKNIDSTAVGLITRYVDENNYVVAYYYFASANKDKVGVWERIGGTWYHRGTTFAKTATNNVWYTLRIRLDGALIEVYLDDNLVISRSVVAASGKIGLTSYKGHAHFDNVLVDNPGDFHVVPEPAPVMISVLFIGALATYGLIRKRSGNKTIV